MTKIHAAAIKTPSGQIFHGDNHGECFQKAKRHIRKSDQGFLDSEGNFISREKAYEIAKNADQLKIFSEKEILQSEFLQY